MNALAPPLDPELLHGLRRLKLATIRAQEALGGRPQTEEGHLGSGPRAYATCGLTAWVSQAAEGHLARSDERMADHFLAGVTDDQHVFTGDDLDVLADQVLGHGVAP